jgi:riboflavin kinase/FMN adenylyltransferase
MATYFRDATGPCLTPRGAVVCIGAFDGVHRGHLSLLARVRERAHARGYAAVAVSFEPVPRQYFQGRANFARLTTPGEKLHRLRDEADVVGMLRFNSRLANTSAEDFVRDVLVGRLSAREVWVGPGFRFGHQRHGDLALLQKLGHDHGFHAHMIDPVRDASERISSSRIRQYLRVGDYAGAARGLGRAFAMTGHVVRGAQLGRKLGYPTANLRVPWSAPAVDGVCAVRVSGAGLDRWPAVASLGTRPTVGGIEPLLEAHLFDFDGDLYGKRLAIEFVAHLRAEARFATLDAMVAQIGIDAARARSILAGRSSGVASSCAAITSPPSICRTPRSR